jgi:hypothetical protein
LKNNFDYYKGFATRIWKREINLIFAYFKLETYEKFYLSKTNNFKKDCSKLYEWVCILTRWILK